MTDELDLTDLEKALIDEIHSGTYTGVDVDWINTENDWVAKAVVSHRQLDVASDETIAAIAKLIDPGADWFQPEGDWLGTSEQNQARQTLAMGKARKIAELVKTSPAKGSEPQPVDYEKPGYYEHGEYLGVRLPSSDTYIRNVTVVGLVVVTGKPNRFMTDAEYADFKKKLNCKCPCHGSIPMMHITPCC